MSVLCLCWSFHFELFSSIEGCHFLCLLCLQCRSQSSLAFWRVDNSVGSFLPADPSTLNLLGRPYELRHILFGSTAVLPKESSYVDDRTTPDDIIQPTRPQPLNSVNSGHRFEAVATFELIWWNRGSGSQKKVSIWRPIVSEGMAYFGDIAVSG